MFIDNVKLKVISGKGGDGHCSFRREKFVPKGGPDGGDGGRGGDVYIVADANLTTLVDFHFTHTFKAEDGTRGLGANMTGRQGKDLYLKVPPGTIVKDIDNNRVIKDLKNAGDMIKIARGGRGGRGNARFKTSTRQAPRFHEKGEPGEEINIELELKMIADVGIIGMANAGKSTLISKLSNARPKIANYPFTTLTPVLGIIRVGKAHEGEEEHSFLAADIPGLIEGASKGKGLGIDFLRHIERTRVHIHVVDPTQGDAFENYRMINKELKAYSRELAKRPQLVLINKCDLLSEKEKQTIEADFKKKNVPIQFISAKSEINISFIPSKVFEMIKDAPVPKVVEEEGILIKGAEPATLTMIEPGVYRLNDKKTEKYIERLDFGEEETLIVFRRYIEKSGLNELFRQNNLKEGDIIVIGERDFVYDPEETGE